MAVDADHVVRDATATLGNGQLQYYLATGRLWWNLDGTGDAGAVLVATIAHRPSITAADIVAIA
jgi:hypothetical protein